MKQLLPWFAALALVIVTFGTIYIVAQQLLRANANYPQIQMAEDTANALDRGDPPIVLVYSDVDINQSLAPFSIIYDKNGKVVQGSGKIDGKVPTAPFGILQAADKKDYHTVTWQPTPSARIAAVTVKSKSYYVLSGRSLREVEKNDTLALQLSLIGAIIAMALFAAVFVLSGYTEDEF